MLLEDRSHVGLHDIVFEGVVAEDAGRLGAGRERLVPVDDPGGERLDIAAYDPFRETGE